MQNISYQIFIHLAKDFALLSIQSPHSRWLFSTKLQPNFCINHECYGGEVEDRTIAEATVLGLKRMSPRQPLVGQAAGHAP